MSELKPARCTLLLVIVVAAVAIGYLVATNRQPPILPDNPTHATFAAPSSCLACHGPAGTHPRGKNHPIGQDCLRCHER